MARSSKTADAELREVRAYSDAGRLGHEGGFGLLGVRIYRPVVRLAEPWRHGQVRAWHDCQWCDLIYGPDEDGAFVLERLDGTRFDARFAA